MTKTLLKKQLAEIFSWVYYNRKTGKNRSKAEAVLLAVAYFALIFVSLGSVFYMMAKTICAPLTAAGFGWLYWSIMGLISVALGVFGSVFNTYSSLYQAKDNDLLLSMPVPVPQILAVRLLGVYLMGLIFELMIMLPALLVWFMNGGSLWALQLPVVISVFVLSLSCILGWAVALIAQRIRRKNVVTVVLSLVFIGGYYYLYANAYKMLTKMLANPAAAAETIRGAAKPFYLMGRGADGNVISFLIFTAAVIALFAVIYLILAKSFISIATANRGSEKKAKHKKTDLKVSSPGQALLKKELARFLGSANYMLNCGLGLIFMPVGGVALLIFKTKITELLSTVFAGHDSLIPLVAAAAVCMIAAMCDITAPSVSLEGKNIWIVQSLPVSAKSVLAAKLNLQLMLTSVPAMLLTAAVLWVIRPQWYFCLLIPAAVLSFILFMALTGLCANLKMPNLNWTSEIYPIKQGASVMIALLGGWVLLLALGGIYMLFSRWISPALFLAFFAALLFTLSAQMLRWVRTTGARIFEAL